MRVAASRCDAHEEPPGEGNAENTGKQQYVNSKKISILEVNDGNCKEVELEGMRLKGMGHVLSDQRLPRSEVSLRIWSD